MYISLGMATMDDVCRAYQQTVVGSLGMVKPTLLHCVSAYPAKLEDMHLANITALRRVLPMAQVGLSDHTPGHTAAVLATALGARVIEKHLCLSRAEGGPDSAFSLEPHEMADLVQAVKEASEAIGQERFGASEGEGDYYRRSLIAVWDIPAGEEISSMNVRVLRPNIGLPPNELGQVVGKRAKRDIKRGEGIKWQDLA
jgi:N-acetylneuraminate synthase